MLPNSVSCAIALLAFTGSALSASDSFDHHLKYARSTNTSNSTIIDTAGFKSVGYFAGWSVYGAQNFSAQQIQAKALTHVIYAFAGINPSNGSAYLYDPWADVQMPGPGETTASNASDMNGSMKQLYLLKKENRHMKTLLSFGGWNMAENVTQGLSTETGRSNFANESVNMMAQLGFDGVDLDWEYPNTTTDAANLVDTCQRIRANLDSYAQKLQNDTHFLLTLAVPAGAPHYNFIDVPGLEPSIDFLNLMAYDYAGSFSNYSGHAANVFKSYTNTNSTDFATQYALNYYLSAGLPAWKLVLGMPLYGHVFNETTGPGATFNNSDPTQPGTNYNALSLNQTQFDHSIFASWTYNDTTKQMITFDHPDIVRNKTQYLKYNRLGGAMFWSLDGDRPLDHKDSLIRTVTDTLFLPAGLGRDWSVNNLDYPDSPYDNLRKGMP